MLKDQSRAHNIGHQILQKFQNSNMMFRLESAFPSLRTVHQNRPANGDDIAIRVSAPQSGFSASGPSVTILHTHTKNSELFRPPWRIATKRFRPVRTIFAAPN